MSLNEKSKSIAFNFYANESLVNTGTTNNLLKRLKK